MRARRAKSIMKNCQLPKDRACSVVSRGSVIAFGGNRCRRAFARAGCPFCGCLGDSAELRCRCERWNRRADVPVRFTCCTAGWAARRWRQGAHGQASGASVQPLAQPQHYDSFYWAQSATVSTQLSMDIGCVLGFAKSNRSHTARRYRTPLVKTTQANNASPISKASDCFRRYSRQCSTDDSASTHDSTVFSAGWSESHSGYRTLRAAGRSLAHASAKLPGDAARSIPLPPPHPRQKTRRHIQQHTGCARKLRRAQAASPGVTPPAGPRARAPRAARARRAGAPAPTQARA